jgi:hypothetical protein
MVMVVRELAAVVEAVVVLAVASLFGAVLYRW